MSFLAKLFGKSGPTDKADAADPAAAEADYKGFTIRAIPRKDQGQYIVAGTIEKVIDGVPKSQQFVRADRSPDRDEIAEMALMKARLMIDQQGDGLFD